MYDNQFTAEAELLCSATPDDILPAAHVYSTPHRSLRASLLPSPLVCSLAFVRWPSRLFSGVFA